MLNLKNTGYITGKYPIFLGEDRGLYDSINVNYPEFFNLFLKQKSQDWAHDEVSLSQSRIDFEKCSKNNYDLMIKNLSYQLEGDSLASSSIIPLFAPFLSNSEAFAMMMIQSNSEVLHALTYSEIIRKCIKNPKELFDEIVKNDQVTDRTDLIGNVFKELREAGAKKILGIEQDEKEVQKILWKAITGLIALEGIEFLSSFSATFAQAEQGVFVGIAKLVQKIMLDEMVHVEMDLALVKNLLKESSWKESFEEIKPELKELLDSVVRQNEVWSKYLFSEGRIILGLNEALLNDYVYHKAQQMYKAMGIKFDFKKVKDNPLPFMDFWTDPDKTQTAAQEIQVTTYKLNTAKDDIGEDELDF